MLQYLAATKTCTSAQRADRLPLCRSALSLRLKALRITGLLRTETGGLIETGQSALLF